MTTSASAAAVIARVDLALAGLSSMDVTDEMFEELPVGPVLAALLWCTDPSLLAPDGQLSFLEASQRMINALDARRDHGIVAFVGSNPRHTTYWVHGDERHLTDARAAEIALALRWSESFTHQRIDSARAQQQLPSAADAFRDGLVSSRTVDAMAAGVNTLTGPLDDAIANAIAGECDPEQVDDLRDLRRHMVSEFDTKVGAFAVQHNPLRIGDKIRNTIAALDPEGAAARRTVATRSRSNVEFRVLADGLGQLTAIMAAEQGLACMRAIDGLARDAAHVDLSDPVGLRRANALFNLVTDHLQAGETASDSAGEADVEGTVDAGGTLARANRRGTGVGVHLDVVMDLATFLGLADTTAMVVGAGPLPAYAARDLLADSAFVKIRRVLVDPVTRHRLDTGVKRYLLTDAERDRILTRDVRCRFPDCNAPALRCECDHAVPYDSGGSTSTANLGALCKRHHQHKTHAAWRITASADDGSCTWQSPLGRTYEHAAQPVPPWTVDVDVTAPASAPAGDGADRARFEALHDQVQGHILESNGCAECGRTVDTLRHVRDLAWLERQRHRRSVSRPVHAREARRSWLELHTCHMLGAPTY